MAIFLTGSLDLKVRVINFSSLTITLKSSRADWFASAVGTSRRQSRGGQVQFFCNRFPFNASSFQAFEQFLIGCAARRATGFFFGEVPRAWIDSMSFARARRSARGPFFAEHPVRRSQHIQRRSWQHFVARRSANVSSSPSALPHRGICFCK